MKFWVKIIPVLLFKIINDDPLSSSFVFEILSLVRRSSAPRQKITLQLNPRYLEGHKCLNLFIKKWFLTLHFCKSIRAWKKKYSLYIKVHNRYSLFGSSSLSFYWTIFYVLYCRHTVSTLKVTVFVNLHPCVFHRCLYMSHVHLSYKKLQF